VSCVEQGRWSYRGKRFDSSDASLFASARARKAARVSTSLREVRMHLSDQGEIWHDVAGKASEHRVKSPTGAMRDFYDRYAEDFGAGPPNAGPRPGQIGALVAVAGKWVGLDLLPRPASSSGPGRGCVPAILPKAWAERSARLRPTRTRC